MVNNIPQLFLYPLITNYYCIRNIRQGPQQIQIRWYILLDLPRVGCYLRAVALGRPGVPNLGHCSAITPIDITPPRATTPTKHRHYHRGTLDTTRPQETTPGDNTPTDYYCHPEWCLTSNTVPCGRLRWGSNLGGCDITQAPRFMSSFCSLKCERASRHYHWMKNDKQWEC